MAELIVILLALSTIVLSGIVWAQTTIAIEDKKKMEWQKERTKLMKHNYFKHPLIRFSYSTNINRNRNMEIIQ